MSGKNNINSRRLNATQVCSNPNIHLQGLFLCVSGEENNAVFRKHLRNWFPSSSSQQPPRLCFYLLAFLQGRQALAISWDFNTGRYCLLQSPFKSSTQEWDKFNFAPSPGFIRECKTGEPNLSVSSQHS